MTTVLIFLLVVVSVSAWWLSHQRLMSKPWLESGPGSVEPGTDRISLPRAKIGLVVFLTVVGILFALITSGYFMRQEISDWRTVPLPGVLWLTTGLLITSSVALQLALIAARQDQRDRVLARLGLACIVAVGFLAGQLWAWQQMVNDGFVLTGNPANSFFYMITGIHGLHIIGGLVALARTTFAARGNIDIDKLRQRIDLCALYWHVLLAIWLIMLVVMLGWVSDPFFDASNH